MKRLFTILVAAVAAFSAATDLHAQLKINGGLLSERNLTLKQRRLHQRNIVIMEQRYNQGVNLGLDIFEDSVSLAESNRRMDSIRQFRPTVGLVLSGGGAKGAAHVGVIRYLEEIGMPVDLVVGTSMGGLVGGLFALGYNAAQMDSIIRNIDWDVTMSDRLSRKFVPYAEARYKEKFLLSFPYHYETDGTDSSDVQYAVDRKSSLTFKEKLMSAVPFGYIYGHNVNDIIKGLSVGYHDSLDFNTLPIPYACVATDLVSGKGKVWHKGSLPVAMRSTMSIPGVFAPVKVDGMVLVDGGMRDNYPADLARRMGADLVIGVDLSGGFYDYHDINNLLDILNAGIDMMGREAYELNVPIPDVTIKPMLEGYDMMSFDSESIDIILQRGYDGALAQASGLDSLKALVGKHCLELQAPAALDTGLDSIYVSRILFKGVSQKEQLVLRKKMPFSEDMTVSRSQIESFESSMLGLGIFEYVTYDLYSDGEKSRKLLPEERPYELVFSCNKAPVDNFGVGIRFDTEELVTALLNFGLRVNRIQGSRNDFNLKISSNPYFQYTYSYDSPKTPTFNASCYLGWTDMGILDFSSGHRLNLKYLQSSQKVYMSNLKWKFADINIGLQNDVFWFPDGRAGIGGPADAIYHDASSWTDYLSLYLGGRAYTMDDGYFPRRGFDGGLSYSWTFARFPSLSESGFDNFHAIKAGCKGAVSIGEIFTFLPSAECSILLGKDMPLVYGNFIGGTVRGRYVHQQIPFIGINGLASMGPFLLKAGMDFRFNLAGNHYLTGMVEYVRDGISPKDWIAPKLGHFGTAVEYAFDSIVGPLSVNVHWSDVYPEKNRFGFFVNFGYSF